jgi:lysophospholipase L1-like esterase
VFFTPKTSIVLLTLLAVACALTSRGAEPEPQRWEKEISAFETQDREKPPAKGGVLFVGSSSIRLWTNLSNDFPNLKVINRGFGGSYLPDTTHFADRIIFPYAPSKIVLYAGDNDIAGGHSGKQVAADFRALVEKVHARIPNTKIYYLAVKPSPSRWNLSPQSAEANRLIRSYCRFRPKVEFIDVWTPLIKNGKPDPTLFQKDQLHLNADGYARWTKVVRPALRN